MSHYYEKPKDWNVAPKDSWVSGKPIGHDEINMPKLGDPGAHENASQKMSFGDEEPSLYQGQMVKQCPAGYSSQNGICTPDPKSEASLESKMKAMTHGQWKENKGGDKPEANSFKRELPKTPLGERGGEADPQIRKLSKLEKGK